MGCLGLHDSGVVECLKNDPYIHRARPDWYFRKYRHSDKLLQCKHAVKCKTYKKWKTRHKESAKMLKNRVDDITFSRFENLQRTVFIDGKKVDINGTIRSVECSNIVNGRDRNFPYTCRKCRNQLRYLKDKLKKRETVKYEVGKRYGKRGVNYKIMNSSELIKGALATANKL